jgi:hypothetical protein
VPASAHVPWQNNETKTTTATSGCMKRRFSMLSPVLEF